MEVTPPPAGRKLNNWIDSYLLYTENNEPTLLYREWMAVSAMCSAMGRKCWLPWEKYIFPNMYILLIGPPAARKGTAMHPAKSILRANNIPLCAEAITREAFFEDMEAATVSLKDMPPEYTCELSSTFTVFSEEFTSFIGYDRGEFLANLCDLWDCPDQWTYRTKGRGVNRMRGACLNLVAATTPELLCKNLPAEAIGGGFTSRSIMVYADKKDRTISDPRYTAGDRILFNLLCEDLNYISDLRGPFSFSQEWFDAYDSFYQGQEKNPPIQDYRFEHYIGRRQTHLQKLCMAFSMSRSDRRKLELDDFHRAEDLLTRTEELMPYAFASHGRVATSAVRPRLADFIKRLGTINVNQLHAAFLNELTWEELEETLRGFKGAGWISEVMEGTQKMIKWNGRKSPGRPRKELQPMGGKPLQPPPG